ncbi:spore cortex-lytic enzyme [Halalkalibacterium halodurans]|uniref:Spore cortex-lytic enzyme n=1 Tax=Halalkalibacterium halodurans (strain ATCC BAA-125 / DSM 18197 / FERM 7344 / JCM 9153 / C-125) TaxID=272558 RepID=SLEB_HALH5|nr:spore cortex-lytic enzyme [Halalkalibacterium halodurans]Q9KCE0.1 RecName: Full=Spore cortex-lytic enzyme; Short=SCLE; Flags: Precursor [Halalkalibacterium halodurans C-125]MED4173071.1 spore cortex-lytic enzyme [Halalkalibacterium halodurans]BAB05350.1 spore cortex-lytic enzyme [Halalkalibacterium halodurans C-125]
MSTRGWLKIPLLSLALFLSLMSMTTTAHAFSDQVIQHGATGDDVVELQARLQYIGFYNKKIDGVFGWSTYWAVRNYQYEFGMEVDGLVGPEMKAKLEKTTNFNRDFVDRALTQGRKFTHYGGVPKQIQKGPKGSADERRRGREGVRQPRADRPGRDAPAAPRDERAPRREERPAPTPEPTPAPPEEPTPYEEAPDAQDDEANIEKATNVPAGYSDNDIQLMAQAVYGEARGEPYVGQVAVAAVILNRLNSPTFPDNVSGVIFEPLAFTAVADGQIYMTPDETARRAVLDALNGQDPSGGATYYFNPDTATSGWIWSRPQIKRIGKHIFCN